jgi:hypothetical protein
MYKGARAIISLIQKAAHRILPPHKAIFYLRLEGNMEQVMTLDQIVGNLKALANPDNVAGMARYGIRCPSRILLP